jgi:hypothetical protein
MQGQVVIVENDEYVKKFETPKGGNVAMAR